MFYMCMRYADRHAIFLVDFFLVAWLQRCVCDTLTPPIRDLVASISIEIVIG
jgi:hypothetical protein